MNIVPTKEQETIINEILKNKTQNYFITGPAGTGKSVLLKCLVERIKKGNSIGVTAMTGIAATSINGKTLHSWAGLGINGNRIPNYFIKKRWKDCKTLIIDEISMCSKEYFENIYKYIKMVRVVFFGDFFQLPPVKGDMIFESDKWNDLDIKIIKLDNVIRQKNFHFIKCLREIRIGNVSKDSKNYLEQFCINNKHENTEKFTKLYCVNRSVNSENDKKLNNINSKKISLKAIDKWKNGESEDLLNIMEKIISYKITIKIGAKVMLIRNQLDGPFVNGSIGEVINFDKNIVYIKFENFDKIEPIYPIEFIESFNKITLTRTQFPLKLAWSLTIHKAQGLTIYKSLLLTVSNSFEYGQCYTGISRITDPTNLIIDNVEDLIKNNKVNPKVIEFYEKN